MRAWRLLLVVLLHAGWVWADPAWQPPQSLPEGFKTTPLALDARICTDRDYQVIVLPESMEKDIHILQRGILKWRDPMKGEITLPHPSRVYCALMYKYKYRPQMKDADFERLEKDGWNYVEEEFQTSTFGAEKWEWQVMYKDLPAGALHLDAGNAPQIWFVGPPR